MHIYTYNIYTHIHIHVYVYIHTYMHKKIREEREEKRERREYIYIYICFAYFMKSPIESRNLHEWVQYLGCGKDRPLGGPMRWGTNENRIERVRLGDQ